MDAIRTRPEDAAERAAAAADIVERRFAADVLFPNVVEYYERWRDDRAAALRTRQEPPLIDVIVRVGGRSVPDTVARAIRSIDAQEAGQFRVVFVCWQAIDLAPITEGRWLRIAGFELVECFGAGRAAALTAGLKRVESPLFCLLDDDDFWLPDHIPSLLAAMADLPPGEALGYSGVINLCPSGEQDASAIAETRQIVNLSPALAGR